MSQAEQVLVVGGVLNIAYGVVTGFPMSFTRTKGAASISKYLTLAHVGPLMQGPILLGMVLAVRMARLSSGIELLGAWLLVAGSILLALKDTLNWLLGVQDEFREKPASRPFGALSVIAIASGTAIFVFGVLRAL